MPNKRIKIFSFGIYNLKSGSDGLRTKSSYGFED